MATGTPDDQVTGQALASQQALAAITSGVSTPERPIVTQADVSIYQGIHVIFGAAGANARLEFIWGPPPGGVPINVGYEVVDIQNGQTAEFNFMNRGAALFVNLYWQDHASHPVTISILPSNLGRDVFWPRNFGVLGRFNGTIGAGGNAPIFLEPYAGEVVLSAQLAAAHPAFDVDWSIADYLGNVISSFNITDVMNISTIGWCEIPAQSLLLPPGIVEVVLNNRTAGAAGASMVITAGRNG